MNTVAIVVYLVSAYVITVHVGWKFYTTGNVYIMHLMENDVAFSNSINKLLLTGYYLLNLGYSAVMITFWKPVSGIDEFLANVSVMLGRIVLTLGVMHFINMYTIYLLSKNHTTTIKK